MRFAESIIRFMSGKEVMGAGGGGVEYKGYQSHTGPLTVGPLSCRLRMNFVDKGRVNFRKEFYYR